MNYRYSPLPIDEYKIAVIPSCEVRTVDALDEPDRTSVWNLYWLSVPELDALPIYRKSLDWHRHYQPVDDACAAVISDAMLDEHLGRILRLHPTRFLLAFQIDNHKQYETYDLLGGQAWVDTVLSRAAQAARRMASEVPALQHSNIYSFRGSKAA